MDDINEQAEVKEKERKDERNKGLRGENVAPELSYEAKASHYRPDSMRRLDVLLLVSLGLVWLIVCVKCMDGWLE